MSPALCERRWASTRRWAGQGTEGIHVQDAGVMDRQAEEEAPGGKIIFPLLDELGRPGPDGLTAYARGLTCVVATTVEDYMRLPTG